MKGKWKQESPHPPPPHPLHSSPPLTTPPSVQGLQSSLRPMRKQWGRIPLSVDSLDPPPITNAMKLISALSSLEGNVIGGPYVPSVMKCHHHPLLSQIRI